MKPQKKTSCIAVLICMTMANIGCSDAKREREASRELKSLEAVNAVKVAALEYDDFAKKLEFAEDGSADAQKSVGLMYATGKGVDKDLSKSFFWYKSAAEQGDADAQWILGYFYNDGEGVAKDEIEAYAYWNLSGATIEGARFMIKEKEGQFTPEIRLQAQERTKKLKMEIEAKMKAKKSGK